MTTLATLLAASGLPPDVAVAWPLHVGWLGVLAMLAFAGLGLSALTGTAAPSPAGASAPGPHEAHREAA